MEYQLIRAIFLFFSLREVITIGKTIATEEKNGSTYEEYFEDFKYKLRDTNWDCRHKILINKRR